MVLPSEKRKTKSKVKNLTTVRLLSKKRRKQLEKVVEKKKKKSRVSVVKLPINTTQLFSFLAALNIFRCRPQRAELLEELAKVQAPAAELKQYVSLTAVQTKGLKRHFREAELPAKEYKPRAIEEAADDGAEFTVNAIKGSKKRRLAILQGQKEEEAVSDPNVIGFDVR